MGEIREAVQTDEAVEAGSYAVRKARQRVPGDDPRGSHHQHPGLNSSTKPRRYHAISTPSHHIDQLSYVLVNGFCWRE